MDKKMTFLFLIGVFIVGVIIGVFVMKYENISSPHMPWDDGSGNTETGGVIEEKYSLAEALKSETSLTLIFDKITSKYNYVDVLLKEFKKVTTPEAFEKYEIKFGGQLTLFLSFKLKDEALLNKYLLLQCELRKDCSDAASKQELQNDVKEVITSLKNNNFYDGEYEYENNVYDLVFIPLLSKSTDEKLALCEQISEKAKKAQKEESELWEAEKQFCKDSVYFMESTKENDLSSFIQNPLYKRLSEDAIKRGI